MNKNKIYINIYFFKYLSFLNEAMNIFLLSTQDGYLQNVFVLDKLLN